MAVDEKQADGAGQQALGGHEPVDQAVPQQDGPGDAQRGRRADIDQCFAVVPDRGHRFHVGRVARGAAKPLQRNYSGEPVSSWYSRAP